MQLTVPDLLQLRVQAHPERTALCVDGTRRLTFADWDRRSAAVARGLLRTGIGAGDRIAVLFDEHGWIDYAIACLAVQRAGAAVVHLATRMTPAQVGYRLDRARVAGIVHGLGVTVPPAGGRWVTTVDGLDHGDHRPVDGRAGPADLCDIAFTSGTTGDPKPIAVPHANLTHGRTGADDRLFPTEQTFLSAWSMGTNASQATVIGALTAQPTVLASSSLDPDHLGRLIAGQPVGAVMLPPVVAAALHRADLAGRYDLSAVRSVGIGSAPVLPAVRRAVAATFRHAAVAVMYSSAESSPAFTRIVFPPAAERPESFVDGAAAWSVGAPSGGSEVRIAGDRGDPGEVWLRSPAPSRRYDDDPAGTARTFRDGWVRTGDLGRLDADGCLHLFDRDGDAVRGADRRISTLPVEAALLEHPAVVEAAGFAVPDGDGERLSAAVVLHPDATPDGLRELLDRRLAAADRPVAVHPVDHLPRNLMGKVVKTALADSLG